MPSEQRWMINDALALLLQLSRSCCLAPVRFIKIRKNTFIYISHPLLLFNIIITFILELYCIYLLYLEICHAEKGHYNRTFLLVFNVCVLIVFVSYAVLHSGTRIKNYMTCLTKLKRAIRALQNTENIYIKKWHVLIIIVILTSGINFILIYYFLIFSGSLDALTYILMLNITMAVVIQLQFLYFALYVSFVLKIIKEQLQEELSKMIYHKDGKQLGNFATTRFNIPLQSINKAIDMIGMTEELFPDLLSKERQYLAQRIHQINECYVLTCELLLELSSSNGFLLFLVLIYCSMGIVLCIYGTINLFNRGSLLSARLIAQCLEILVFVIRIIMVVEPCHMAHEEIMKIRFLVCEIMCYVTSTSDPIFRVIDGIYQGLVSNDISYTVLGMCKIGRPLLTSIIAAVITVLITIFEF